MLPVLGVLFLAGQGAMLGTAESHATQVKVAAWLVWVILLLLLLAFGGGLFHRRSIRSLVEDEVTLANRARGYTAGFWAGMLAGIGLYVLSLFEPVSGREAIHIVMSAAIAGALVTFGALERRSLRGGR